VVDEHPPGRSPGAAQDEAFSVEANIICGGGAVAKLRELAIDCDAPVLNPLLDGTSRA